MGCPTQVELEQNIVFTICVHDPMTGAVTDAAADPAYRIYEEDNGTAILTGTMAKLDDAGTTGFYAKKITCSSPTFSVNKTYSVYITAVVGVDTGSTCYSFNITNILARTPTGTPGAASGALIAGSNAATTFATFTCTGQLSISDGLVISCTTTNKDAVNLMGNGSGDGFMAMGGNASGATAGGNGLRLIGGTAHTGGGASGVGLSVTGGSGAASGAGAADGAIFVGGSVTTVSGGHGIRSTGTGSAKVGLTLIGGTNASGGSFVGNGTGHGLLLTGGTSGATGNGLQATSVATNGSGIGLTSTGTGSGLLSSSVTVSGTTTLTGAVALGSTLGVTGTTTFAAINTGAVGLTTLATSGTTTLNALTVTAATTLTGAVTATHASNDIRGIDVAKLSGDATAADNAEAFFDGTGYAGTNNVIPTVTTVNGLAANTVTASALAADAVTEIQAGLATSSILTTAIADSIPADGSMPSLSQAVYMILQFLMERAVVGTTLTVKKPDGSTTLLTCTLNNSSAPTSITRAT